MIPPYSIRIPEEMRDEIKMMADADHRSLHSMILRLLDDALAMRRAGAPGLANATSAFPAPPVVPTPPASAAECELSTVRDHPSVAV